MHTKIKTILIAGATLLSLTLTGFSASAKSRGIHASETTPDTYGRRSCDSGYRGRGYDSHYRSDRARHGSYRSQRSYGSHSNQSSYRTSCRPIHTCFSVRHGHRYKTTTYLHTKTDCHGHVVSRWRTEKTVCVGSYRY